MSAAQDSSSFDQVKNQSLSGKPRPHFQRLNWVRTVVRLAVVMWLLAACADGVEGTRSSTTVVDHASGLPMGGPQIPGAPEVVASRVPLPYCGAEIGGDFPDGNPYENIEIVANAGECYRSRAASGQPAELVTVGVTMEGDPYLSIRRLMPDGREIAFLDATQDKFGAMAWVMTECDHFSESGLSDAQCIDVEIADSES